MRDAVRPGLLRRGFRKMKLGLATCALATTMAFGMPLMDARAQPGPPSPATARPGTPPAAKRPVATKPPAVTVAKKLYSVDYKDKSLKVNMTTTLNYGGKERTVYMMASGKKKPTIYLKGPAKLTIRVYPAVNKTDFNKAPEYNRTIECEFGPVGGAKKSDTYTAKTRDSKIKHSAIADTLTIGTPLQFTVEVGPGRQELTVLKPNGFLEVVGVKLIAKPTKRVNHGKTIVINTDASPEKKPKTKPKKEPRMLFSTNVEHLQLKKFRPKDDSGEESPGDLTVADILGHIPLGKSGVSLLLGTHVTSYGVVLDTADANNSLRSLSTNFSLGIGFSRGRHYLTALAFGGYRHMWGKVTLPDGRKNEKETKHGEGGGAFGYAYNPYFSMLVSGSNNPFNPLTVKLHGMLHKGWVKDHKPWLDVDLLWLRDAVALDESGLTGGMALSRDQVYIRALAGLPLVRFSIITLSIAAGGEMMISEDRDVRGTALFGAEASIDWNGLNIGVTGLSSIDGAPLVLFNLSYRR